MFKRYKKALLQQITRIKKSVKQKASSSWVIAKIASAVQYYNYKNNNSDLRNELMPVIDTFVNVEQKSDKYLRHVIKDMLFSKLYYHISYKEYFLYRFEYLSDSGRKQYIGFYDLMSIFRKSNNTGKPGIFKYKNKTYEIFKDFYKRKVLFVTDVSQEKEFIEFVLSNSPCVIKPIDNYGGKGIEFIDTDIEEDCKQIFDEYKNKMPFFAEEKIVQDNEMAKYHPQSVNTIRYNTFLIDDKLIKVQAVIRMGKGNSFVDNATSGGIYALIDIETGIIISPAKSYKGESYLVHPDTGVQILGNRIPRWEELNELIELVSRRVPEQKQVGWDFALSKDGWIMVEGNTLPEIQSFDVDHGLRQYIMSTLGEAVSFEE